MKVLIYNADIRLARIFSMRFRRLGHQVISVYENKATDEDKIEYDKGNIVYQGTSEKKLRDILRFESPEMIVWGQIKMLRTEDEAALSIAKISMLARLSVKYNIRKFLFISSLDVYSKNITDEQHRRIEPETLHGKIAFASENIITGFRSENKYQNIFYRVSDIFGLNEPGEDLDKILNSVANNKSLPQEFEGKQTIPLFEGDLADAVVKAVSDFAEGVYDLCGEKAYTFERIYNMVAERFNKQELAVRDEKSADAPPDCTRALREIRWLRLYPVEKALDNICSEWKQQGDESVTVIPKLKERKNLFQSFAENTGVFLLVAFIQWNLPISIGSEPLLLYVIAAAAMGGISHGVFASVLVLGYHVYEMLIMGFGLDAMILHHTFILKNLFYLAAAIIIGYVVERKNIMMNKVEEKAAFIEQERDRILVMNEELALIKAYQEKKLLGYEDGIARLYKVFLSLEMKSVTEIFLHAPRVVKELTGEENVGIYIVQKSSKFIRRFAFIGKSESLVPTTFRYSDIEAYKRIIDYNEFYINKRMEREMPSIVMPISIKGEVAAVLVIEEFAFEKHTRYYLNMVQIAGHIISDFSEKMTSQLELMSKIIFEEDSHIMNELHFKSACDTAVEISRDTVFDYSILEVVSGGDDRENAEKIRRELRSVDKIGRLENGKIGVLLYGANRKKAGIVIGRICNLGIESRVI